MTPKFATALNATVDFIVGNRSEWTLPLAVASPLKMRTVDPILATIPTEL